MKTYKERTASILEKSRVLETEKQSRKKTVRRFAILGGTAAAVTAFALVLFVPYSVGGVDLDEYKGSEYYSVIKNISALTYDPPRKTNNFNEWFGHLFTYGSSQNTDGAGSGSMMDGSGPMPGGDGTYEEVTDNQTAGAIEGDLFKRSSEYIFYLDYIDKAAAKNGDQIDRNSYAADGYTLDIYTIAGAGSNMVSSYVIDPDENTYFSGYHGEREMYLSSDCKTVTVITPCFNCETDTRCTAVIGLDVSEPTDVKEITRTYISGKYVSSRLVGEELIVTSEFAVNSRPDFDKPAQYLPQAGELDDMKSVAADDIIIPESPASADYTVICSLDAQTFAVNDSLAFLSAADELYVSDTGIYAIDGRGSVWLDNRETEFYRVSYGDGTLGKCGNFVLSGSVENRYSLDERDGVLRIFTTSSERGEDDEPYFVCNLYCIDTDGFEIIAKAEDFAPHGDIVRSARFYGDTAYVCTAYENIQQSSITDPVYAFDLRDYNDIKYTNTDTIPGYSLALKRFKDDTLVGIGYGDSRSKLKIELYRETAQSVETVDKYEKSADFSHEYKSYFIDADDGFIGLAVHSNAVSGFTGYLLLHYDGYELIEAATVPFAVYEADDARAAYIDGYLYVFGDIELHVVKVRNDIIEAA